MKSIKIKICIYIIILLIILLSLCVKVQFNFNEDKERKEDIKIEEIKYTNNRERVDALVGKWKFTKRISYPKAYSKNAQTLCDNAYLGRTIEIKKGLFQGKTFEIENPFYNMISVSNPYEIMSGYGYLRNSVLKKCIQKKEKYDLLELLENRPQNKDNNTQNKDNDIYINFEDECYQDNDIWTLLVIDDDTMIFFEDGCFEVKKIVTEEPTE